METDLQPIDENNLPPELSQEVIYNKKFRPKNIPTQTIIKYRKQGLSVTDIAKIVGCDRSNITRRLQRHKNNILQLKNYKNHKADIIDFKASEVLKHLTPSKLEKASAYQLTGMYGILNTHSRLEHDKSTQNIATLTDDLAELRKIRQGGN